MRPLANPRWYPGRKQQREFSEIKAGIVGYIWGVEAGHFNCSFLLHRVPVEGVPSWSLPEVPGEFTFIAGQQYKGPRDKKWENCFMPYLGTLPYKPEQWKNIPNLPPYPE